MDDWLFEFEFSPVFWLRRGLFSPLTLPSLSDLDNECSRTPSQDAPVAQSRNCCDFFWTEDCHHHSCCLPTRVCHQNLSLHCWGSGSSWGRGIPVEVEGWTAVGGRGWDQQDMVVLATNVLRQNRGCWQSMVDHMEDRRGNQNGTLWQNLLLLVLRLYFLEFCWWRTHLGPCFGYTRLHWSVFLWFPKQRWSDYLSCTTLSWRQPPE